MSRMSPIDPEIDRTAQAMADAARAAILPHFRTLTLATDNKETDGFDPVTEADRAAELAMRAVLKEMRPSDAVLGEEYGHSPGTSGLTWVLDPIDGTRAFICGAPTWGVLISLRDAAGPFYGMIDQPYIQERFVGHGDSATLTGPLGQIALRTRTPRPLREATILTTYPEVGDPPERRAFGALAAQCQLTRYGMDCYAYALLAAGQVDLVVEAGLNAYDIQAPIALIEAAGGVVTDWSGKPAHDGGRALAAANKSVHAAALEILSHQMSGQGDG